MTIFFKNTIFFQFILSDRIVKYPFQFEVIILFISITNPKPDNYCEPTIIDPVEHMTSSHKMVDSTSYWEYWPNTGKSFHCCSICIPPL